jgi:hypothetical protein
MSEDRFLERLRGDARLLRYEPGDAVLTRLAAKIRERIQTPGVSQLIASWFRPLAASLAAVGLAGSIGLFFYFDRNDVVPISDPIEISMAGDVYSVGD